MRWCAVEFRCRAPRNSGRYVVTNMDLRGTQSGCEGGDHVVAGTVDPMRVLEDQDRACRGGRAPPEPSCRRGDSDDRRRCRARGCVAVVQAHGVEKHSCVVTFQIQTGDLGDRVGPRFLRRKTLDSEHGPHQPRQSAKPDAGGVGLAASNDDPRVADGRELGELTDQPGLAQSGFADDTDRAAGAGVEQLGETERNSSSRPTSAPSLRPNTIRSDCTLSNWRARTGSAEPLMRTLVNGPSSAEPLDQTRRRLRAQHTVGRRHTLHPLCHPDWMPYGGVSPWPRADFTCDDLTRVESDPNSQFDAVGAAAPLRRVAW